MTIKTGDLVIVSTDNSGNSIATKCYSTRLQNKLTLKARCSDGEYAGIYVIPMKFNNDIGYRPDTSDSQKAAVAPARGSFIAMCWIDEATPIYTDTSDDYLEDLNEFNSICERSVKWSASCQSPSYVDGRGIQYCIHEPSGYPQDLGVNIHMEDVHRSPDITDSELTSMFDLLLNEFRNTPPTIVQDPDYIILSIDSSGSMKQETIDPAYTNLKSYIQSLCPSSDLRETTFSNEAWLGIWYDQIKNII